MYGVVVDHFEITPSALLFMARNGHLKDGVWYWEGLQDPSAAASHLLDEEGEGMLRWDAARCGFYDTNPYYGGKCPISPAQEKLYVLSTPMHLASGEKILHRLQDNRPAGSCNA